MAEEGITLEEAEVKVDEAHAQKREAFEAWKAEKKQELIDELTAANPEWTADEIEEEADRIIAERKEQRRANGGGCPNKDQDEEDDEEDDDDDDEEDDDEDEDEDEEDETNLAQVD